MLTREQIRALDDLPVEEVEIPEWGGTVLVRGLQGNERDRYEYAMFLARKDPDQKLAARARLVATCTLGEDRKRLFTDADTDWIGRKNAAALDRIFDVVQRLSGMDKKAAEVAEEIFGDGRNDGSTSGSPATSDALSESYSNGAHPPSSPNGSPTNAPTEFSDQNV
jgi:hypothetical protein